jgi:hypothetical protein
MRTQPPSYDAAGMAVMRQRQDAVVVEAGSARPYQPDVTYDVESFDTLRFDLIRRAVDEVAQPHLGFIERLGDINTRDTRWSTWRDGAGYQCATLTTSRSTSRTRELVRANRAR